MALGTLLQVLQAETVLCNELAAVMDAVLKGLLARDTGQVQDQLGRFNQLSASLAQAEAVRTSVYEDLCRVAGMDPTLGMSALIMRLDAAHRPAFAGTLRDFRMATSRMASLSRGIATYTNAQLLTIESFMVEFFPQRDTGTYGADGSRCASARPMLVNSLS